ncbi:DUF4410 domain-containing protein [Halioglobus maricola]|nr:DUF4410 domain-containing protein [Halioglobus maricola]
MTRSTIRLIGPAALVSLTLSQSIFAQGNMDYTNTYIDKIDSAAPIHVHPFGTADADLGNPKFEDTAQAMAKSAPHLLATDIVSTLRNSGFTAVTLDESKEGPAENAMNLTGHFTKLDPGSQNLRVWVGLGAGESKVCISGQLTDAAGKKLADFADCRNGLGWGASGPQGNKGAEVLGERVAKFLINWAGLN